MATSEDPQMLEVKNNAGTSRKKTEQTKKMELVREIHKLNIQIQKLEKEKLTHIFSKISDFREQFGPMEEEEIKLTEERNTGKMKIKQQLEKMSYLIKRFQRELRDVKPTPEFVEKLKSMMEEIEEAIHSFKEQHRIKYDDMMRSEKTLHLELQQLERKFEAWNQASKTDNVAPQAVSSKLPTIARDISKDLPPEVVAFDKFVQQSGGHQGGWDEQDHQTFLRYRNMYKGRIVFLDHVTPMLPTHTATDIREHESWFQEYTFLNESKKYAVKKWREKKEEDKEDAISQVQSKLESQKEEDIKKHTLTAEEKAERCHQINAWKVQKELEKAMKEERKRREEMEKKKQREEERKHQLETRRKVEEFRQQKQIEDEVLAMIDEERKQEETERRREIMAKEISRFRNRRLIEKLEKEREKEDKKKEKEKKLEAMKFQVEVTRDPSRLLMPTAGWNERLKEQGPSGGGQVFKMPHRAVPSWRQGLF
ncbi:hypothetical protein BsWGS_04580 [Bradybaena similaris]